MLWEFGISPGSARAALARLVRRGLVGSRGCGRSAVCHVRSDVVEHHRAVMHGFLAFGAVPRPWDGRWLVVSSSLPEARQPQRHAVRKALAGQSTSFGFQGTGTGAGATVSCDAS